MVTVRVAGYDDSFGAIPFELRISGHARFARKGDDIVCSAVSALFLTARNALVEVAGCSIDYAAGSDESFLKVDFNDGDRGKAETVIRTVIVGLKAIAVNYPEHCKIII